MNDQVYLHELIDITKQNRARYMHHMAANWSPLAQELRHRLCYGVWGVVGSTGRWPWVRGWTNHRVRAQVAQGRAPGPESSIGKVHAAELNQRVQAAAADLLGAAGVAWRGDADDLEDYARSMPAEVRGMLRSRANTIESGTAEVNRNVLAETGARAREGARSLARQAVAGTAAQLREGIAWTTPISTRSSAPAAT